MSETNEQKQVWLFDRIAITHTDVQAEGVTYSLTFVDFCGFQKTIKVSRDDCYFDFDKVLRALVKAGFRFNTLLPHAPAAIRAHLTAYRPNPEVVKAAIEQMSGAPNDGDPDSKN